MNHKNTGSAFILGFFICAGLALMGYLLSSSIMRAKALDRTVTVKGLAERDVPADVAIWPIRFSEAGNDLARLVGVVQQKSARVTDFLVKNGFSQNEISVSPPAILDRQAQGYGNSARVKFRYTATATITVYTRRVKRVRQSMKKLVDLARQGIAISGQDYEAKTQFLFTGLNRIKPEMVQTATRKARQVAEKFAQDSQSRLGKIKQARQGQFSISNRDSNTPYIKKVRVVSTLVYYLSD